METRIYIATLFSLVISASMFVYSFVGDNDVWLRYYFVYLVVAIAHVWYTLLTLAKEDIWPRVADVDDRVIQNEDVAIVIPTFNEKPELLTRTIRGALDCGVGHVYVVNDGSTNDTDWDGIRAMDARVIVGGYPDNRGKREALRHAVKTLLRDEKYAVFTDSDTIFDRDSVSYIVRPLLDAKVGAVAGDVRILNSEENWLTKICNAYYWIAFNISRRSQSALGQTACCSGALAAYKVEFLRKNIDEFARQTFRGRKCTYGEDRHLTNMVLRDGYDVVFESRAFAYTEAPTSFRKFWKQQLRWRRGFFQEAIYAIPFMWRVKPMLWFEIVVWDILWPMLSLGVFLSALVYAIVDPALLFFGIIPSLIGVAVVRYMPIFFYGRQHVFRMLLFTMLSNFVMVWQSAIALFTVRSKAWETR